jgi:DnaJ-domain-containing protein 1
MARVYLQKTIVELEALFNANSCNVTELKKLAAELKHRKVPRAVALSKKVSEALNDSKAEEPEKEYEGTKESSHNNHKDTVIECQACNQKLRIKLSQESAEYSCPSCNSKFQCSFSEGVLSVIFVKPASNNSKDDSDNQSLEITLNDAYKLFDANASSPWELIELTRRRLIQQYHPDKVASLGPKLKLLAETEGKRINIAYDLLRKEKGL